MININDIKSRSSLILLEKYDGVNPYILKFKNEYLKNNKLRLTENQSKYIIDNYDVIPQYINKVVNITEYLGNELKNKFSLDFTPKRLLIEFILAENEKNYHVYSKFTKKQIESNLIFIPKTQVLDDPYFEEIDLNVDFDKYDNILGKYGKKLYEHQKSGVKFLLSRNGAILADGMGLGKGCKSDTYIFTPKGKVKIGTLKVGDEVIGSNGKPTKVTGVFPQGVKNIFKVTFNDGYSLITDNTHLWTVSSSKYGENSKNSENRYITLSTEQMLDEELELTQIGTGWNEKRPYKFKTYYKQKNGNSKWQVPIVKPIEFSNDDILPIEPYLLGVFLGDGHITKSSNIRIELGKIDFDEILNGVLLSEHKCVNKNNKKGCISYLKKEIIDLKLTNTRSDTKFIPEIYKYSSIENRLAILQGLMDTDGHCNKSKKIGIYSGTEYCTASEKLADDVAEIVHSLGGIVRKSSKIGSYKKPDGTKVNCKRVYKLNIKLPNEFNPFRLARKANSYNTPTKYPVGRYIKNIEPMGMAETVCISVDAPDELYVVEHGIVTHNTTQAIVAALESGAKRVLIVTPSSTKINWEREINVFCDKTSIINGNTWKRNQFVIVNFDILKNFHTLVDKRKKTTEETKIIRDIVDTKFDLCIVDEAHNLKNSDSIRGKIMLDVCVNFGIEKVWLLTGTPIANRPMDFFNLLKLIKSPIADNWRHYAIRYCEGRNIFRTLKNGKKKKIWLTDGASNLDELNRKTKNHLLRRLKTDVLDLPDKIVTPVYHDLTEKELKQYNLLWDEYIAQKKLQKKSTSNLQKDLIELILLREFIARIAIPYTIEMAEDAIESGHKVIIFTTFKEELDILANHFGKIAVRHNGEMSIKDKQFSVDEFQNNEKIKVFVGNTKSAGVGITLTSSDVTIFNSFDWVPGVNEQAEDRNYRIGQTNMVNIYYQLFLGTISTRMWETIKHKQEIIDIILNGEKIDNTDEIIDKILEYDG